MTDNPTRAGDDFAVSNPLPEMFAKLRAEIAALRSEVERLKERRVHLIPEPECACYEYIGGHQMGCPMHGMTLERVRKWQDDHAAQCHEIEETIQWKNFIESRATLTESIRVANLEVERLNLHLAAAKENADFLRESVGECHLMISRSTSEFQMKPAWELTTLPRRLQKIMQRIAELEKQA